MHKLLLSIAVVSLILFGAILFAGCSSAFKPPFMGDVDEPVDGDMDQDIAEMEEEEAAETFNLILKPDFLRVGASTKTGEITFKNADELKARLEKGDPSFPNWRIDFGNDIRFDLIRFDAENLRFYDIEMVVWAKARTGKRTVSARITYGNVTVVEYGEFFVLPALDKKIKQQKKK